MSQQVKAFTRHEFQSRMRVSPSRMDVEVLYELNRRGCYPLFQNRYYLGLRLWQGRMVHLTTTPEYDFDKQVPDVPKVFYNDQVEVHLKRQSRDAELRLMLTEKYGLEAVGIPYERYSRRERNRIVGVILEALK